MARLNPENIPGDADKLYKFLRQKAQDPKLMYPGAYHIGRKTRTTERRVWAAFEYLAADGRIVVLDGQASHPQALQIPALGVTLKAMPKLSYGSVESPKMAINCCRCKKKIITRNKYTRFCDRCRDVANSYVSYGGV